MALGRLSVAFLLLPLSLGLAAGGSTGTDGVACETQPPTETRPVEGILATLDELHALYAGMAGFVDVYYYAGDAVEYRPMFVGEVPAAARDVATPVPVSFDTIASAPDGMGPGLVPDQNDAICSGIRPGARLVTNGVCTTNFVFQDSAGNRYIGTAGHCVSEGQIASISNIGTIGTVVFSTGDGGVGDDFALIRINADKLALVNPEMCSWAGPTGVFNGAGITGRRVLHTGHGYGLVGTPVVPTPPRPKIGVGSGYGATSLTWAGAPWPGDSGSAIRLDGGTSVGSQGQGVGILTHGIGVADVGVGGLGFGTRLDKAIQMSGISGLSLVTVSYAHIH